ncbi:MAG: hypothetical protein M3442_07910, partial [Chloroflexota bacterium]|nr:hypothetical protein [Chloroflexota bacterium]
MTDRPLWRDIRAVALRLPASDWRTLRLLARLPLLWPEAIADLTGLQSTAGVYRSVARLRQAGLVAACRVSLWPFRWAHTGHPPRLLHLTDAGAAAVALAPGTVTNVPMVTPANGSAVGTHSDMVNTLVAAIAGRGRLARTDVSNVLPNIAHRAAAYALLAALARRRPGAPRVHAWESPWRRSGVIPSARHPVTVALPAAALLAWPGVPGTPAVVSQYLLLPDLGTAPVTAYRQMLGRLSALHAAQVARAPQGQASGRAESPASELPELAIATTEARRVGAWQRLLDGVADDYRAPRLAVHVATWAELAEPQAPVHPYHPDLSGNPRTETVRLLPLTAEQMARLIPATLGRPLHDGMHSPDPPRGKRDGDSGQVPCPKAVARPGRAARTTLGTLAAGLTAADRVLLDVVGRHPFLSSDDLATV